MANEGISAALKLDPQILKDLDSAQKTIQAMRAAAEGLAKGFQDMGAAVTNLAKGIKGTGVSFESMFDKSGTLRSLKIASDAIQQTARTTTSVVKTEAQKQADEAEKAAKRAAAAEQRRQETMKRSASYLNTEAQNAMAINPKGLEQMKEQLRQLTSLQRRFNTQVIKGNPYVDPAMSARINSAITQLRSNISSVEKRIQSLNTKLATTSGNASMVRTLLMTAFNPLLISRFLQQMITVRGEFEFAQRSLAVIIRDEGKARDMFNEITQIAVRSPFSVSDLLKQTKQLAAYRIEADKLIDTTKMLGDIAAGVGVDMNRLILAYGQVKAAEFLKGTELRQFSEAGVNMLGGLADRFSEIYNRSVSVGEVMQMISKRMVKFADVEAVLRQATEAGGTFYKMQEQQADTLRGKIVNLGDRIQIMFNQVGQSYDGLMKRIVAGLENVVANWKAVSNFLVPLLSAKLITGSIGLLANTTLIKNILKYFRAINIETVKMTSQLTLVNRAGNFLKATFAGIGATLKANVLGVLTMVVTFIIQAWRNATQLRRELEKIESDALVSMDRQVERYNQLLDVALDTTKAEYERQQALDALKAEYGNILDIQDVELTNLNKMNDARAQQIQLIKQQAYEQARQSALASAVADVQKQRKRQLSTIMGRNADYGVEDFIKAFQKEVPGLLYVTENEIEAAMDETNKMLLDGAIQGGKEARDQFLTFLLRRSGADDAKIEEILGGLSDPDSGESWAKTYDQIAIAFKSVVKSAKELDGFGDTLGIDLSSTREVQKYREEIKKIEDVANDYLSKLTNQQKELYRLNPAKQQLDVHEQIKEYADKMKEAVANGEFGEVGEEMQKVLNREIEAAFRKAAPESELDLWMVQLFSDLNDEFGNASGRLQSGMMRWENGQDEAKFIKNLDKELEDLQKTINTLKHGNGARVDSILDQLGIDRTVGTRAEQLTKALMMLMEYDEMLHRLKDEGDFNLPPTATEIKQKQRDLETLATDVIDLANGWWLLSENEKKAKEQELGGRMNDLGILLPPDSMDIQDIADWIKREIREKIEPVARMKLDVRVDKEAEKEVKELSDDFKGIADDLISYYKKTASEKLPKEVGDSILSVIEDRVAEFNKNPNKKTTVMLPLAFDLDSLAEWVEQNKDNLTKEALTDILLALNETRNSSGGSGGSSYKSDLKAFLSDLKNARKEMDKLTDEEDKLFVKKLQHQGKKVGIQIAEDFEPTKEVLDEIINKYLPKLDRADQIDLRLTWSKEDTADTIKGLSDAVNRLWDQYDNAKKMEEWGLVPKEGDTKVTMHRIMALEQELRDKNTEESIKAADEIKKKRLEIARSEQEEIAKLMYDTQKKSLTKIETVYKEMYDNIAKFRSWKNADERDAAINDQIAKSMRELADAEWDAYKSTEAYALAFGDLEGLSRDVLKTLHGDLKAWLEQPDGALQPSEVQTIVKAMQKMEELMNVEKVSSYFDAVKKGFRSIGDAKSAFRDMEEIQELLRPLLAAREEAYQKMMSLAEKAGQAATQENIDAAADAKAEYEDLVELINALVAALNRAKASYKASLDNASKYVDDANDAFNTMRQTIEGAIDLVVEIGEAFGATFSDETNAAIEGFRDGFSIMGNALGLVASVLVTAKLAAMALETTLAGLMSMVWPYLAAAAVIGTIIAVIKARDAALQKQVEEHKDNVERLEREYDKLEKAIESALNITKLRQTYAEMNANLAKQRQEIQEAIDANNKRKQNDERRKETEELQNQLDEIDEKVEDTRDKWLEMLGAPTDYQDVARDWADSWLDAFKETGSGLDALRESFDELYDDLVVGQLWSQIMAPQIENLQKMVKDALADGDLTEAEAAAIRAFKNTLAFTSGEMEERAKALGIAGGSLSGNTLQRGVESVTEQTAQALESILNATRYDVSDTNVRVANIEAVLAGEGENTILAHLRSQTRYLADIARIASAVYAPGGHYKGGNGGIKVYAEIQ